MHRVKYLQQSVDLVRFSAVARNHASSCPTGAWAGGGKERAFLTAKRSLENYLHVDAVSKACGVHVEIDDETSVAEAVAQKMLVAKRYQISWAALSYRTRKRLRKRAKRLLNLDAVDCMAPERLDERDPAGEVILWLRTIGEFIAKRF